MSLHSSLLLNGMRQNEHVNKRHRIAPVLKSIMYGLFTGCVARKFVNSFKKLIKIEGHLQKSYSHGGGGDA